VKAGSRKDNSKIKMVLKEKSANGGRLENIQNNLDLYFSKSHNQFH